MARSITGVRRITPQTGCSSDQGARHVVCRRMRLMPLFAQMLVDGDRRPGSTRARAAFGPCVANECVRRMDDHQFAGLPPLLRALLLTDGTVTKVLEAYLWEPIRVE